MHKIFKYYVCDIVTDSSPTMSTMQPDRLNETINGAEQSNLQLAKMYSILSWHPVPLIGCLGC